MKQLIVLLALLHPNWSHATLGETENSCERDRQRLGGEARTGLTPKLSTAIRTHEMTAQGSAIKQYLTPEGTVFALSWRGLAHPDLAVLLGAHYAEYRATAAQLKHQPGRATRRVETSKAVITRAGHMRDVRGVAYLPELVPQGFKLEDLQ